MKKKHRVKSKCLSCGRTWWTKAKKDDRPPRRCHGEEGCGSTKVIKLKSHPVKPE